jgi:hypothetical protein
MRTISRWIKASRVKNFEKRLRKISKIAQNRGIEFTYNLPAPQKYVITENEFNQLKKDSLNLLFNKYNVSSVEELVKNPLGLQEFNDRTNLLSSWIPYMDMGKNGIENFRMRTGSVLSAVYGDLSDSGWEVIAVIDPMFESAFGSQMTSDYVINMIPGLDFDDESMVEISNIVPQEINSYCIHCNSTRQRKSLVLVRNKETGEYRRVGTNCLMAYTAIDPKVVIDLYSIGMEKTDFGSGGHNFTKFDVKGLYEFLQLSTQYFESKGAYLKGRGRVIFDSVSLESEEGDYYMVNYNYPNKHQRQDAYNEFGQGYFADGRLNFDNNRVLDFLRMERIMPPTEDIDKMVSEMISYVGNMRVKSSFERNLKAIVDSGKVSMRTAGYAASIYIVYKNAVEKGYFESLFFPKVEKIEEVRGNHIGEIGERIRFDAQLVRKQEKEGYYGITTMMVFETDDGSEVIWWSSSNKRMPMVGDIGTVVGTVKKHGEFKGKKTTTITRAKLVDWD